MEREYFKPKQLISAADKMIETDFYHWLENHKEEDRMDEFIPALTKFLGEQGFNITCYKLEMDQVKAHRLAHMYFWDNLLRRK